MIATIVVLAILAAIIMPPFIIFVSIVWTHQPDLSVGDILRECVNEINNWLRKQMELIKQKRRLSGKEK